MSFDLIPEFQGEEAQEDPDKYLTELASKVTVSHNEIMGITEGEPEEQTML